MTLRFGVLTISDRAAQGERQDASGPALESAILSQGWSVIRTAIVPDERNVISQVLSSWCDWQDLDLILTTGGTGFSQRDITPEATQAVIERSAPGIAETMRFQSLQVTAHAMLSRGIAGIRGTTLIINLPGSPKAAVENFQVVLPVLEHAVQLLQDDPTAEKNHRTGAVQ